MPTLRLVSAEVASPPKERILVIEDDPVFSDMLKRLLAMHERSAVVCSTPAEALAALSDSSFTAVLMDLYFGGLPGGYDFLREVRANPRTSGIPIVAMSGKAIVAVEKCLDLGADAVLAKPFPSWEAIAAIDRAVGNRRAAAVLRGTVVLHIEDSDDWADLVNRWLREVGATTSRAKDGAGLSSIAEASGGLPDVILLDLGLGGTDGLGVLDAIKRSPALQSVPVVILSSRTAARPEALRRRAVFFIDKGPDTREELIAVLASVCDQHRRSRGFITAGGLVFDPSTGSVRYKGRLVATLDGRPLALFSLLARRGAGGADENELFSAGQRRVGRSESHRTVHNYVSELRQLVGPELGALIRSLPDGRYALKFPDVDF